MCVCEHYSGDRQPKHFKEAAAYKRIRVKGVRISVEIRSSENIRAELCAVYIITRCWG